MKISRQRLKQIIQEEVQNYLNAPDDIELRRHKKRRGRGQALLLRDMLKLYRDHESLVNFDEALLLDEDRKGVGFFNDDNVTSELALQAFNELMLAIAGPSGYWKSTIPGAIGCATSPESGMCQAYQKAVGGDLNRPVLKNIDAFLRAFGQAEDHRAYDKFLARNMRKIEGLLKYYVPVIKGGGDKAGVMDGYDTGFGQAWNMKKVLEGSGGREEEDDL
jgi:hypothetical protein